MISVIALPMGFGCALLAKPLVMLVLGAKWQDAILVVQVLACVFALGTMTSTYYPLALAKGETRLLFKRDMLIFCVRVPIIVVGMLLGGMPGIIYARLVAYVISCTIEMMLVHYLIGLSARQQFENNTRSLLSVLAMSVTLILATQIEPANAGWIEQAVRLSGLTALGAAVYLCFLFAFWFVADCPVGPEADFLSLLGKVRIKWSTIRSA
jgi:O-antigen/teichoic acid export membrane protein